ncbi:MAG TPA: hypothetical protein VFL95_07495 [Gemmatimonadales bacterium]|nr:hypothetical protein [Gemmatimonadales bacterium]
MMLYRIALIAHFLAVFTWLGHMFFWPLFAGPVLKKIQPGETAQRLRTLSMSMGGLGWPALVVLVLSGGYMLSARGVGFGDLFSAVFWHQPWTHALAVKLPLVGAMIVYQAVIGHRPAPRAIYLDMLAALLVLGASVMLARGF